MGRTVARLPRAVRGDLREPLGPVVADVDALLDGAGDPVVAVGDVVTAHLLEAGRPPRVAVVDGRSERERVPDDVARVLDALAIHVRVENAAGTLSAELVAALAAALEAAPAGSPADPDGTTTVSVDGEEDLATLPAVLFAPDGAAVVYGQPGEGMVRVDVDRESRERVRELLERFETDGLWELVDGRPGDA